MKRSRKRRDGRAAPSTAREPATPNSDAPDPGNALQAARRRRTRLAATLVVLAGAALGFTLFWSKTSQNGAVAPDPATQPADSTAATARFAGGRDDGYVDASACAGCHQQIQQTYQHTGMGRSFYRPLPEKMVEDFSRNPSYYHKPSDRYYTMLVRDGAYYQRRHQLDARGNEINVFEQRIDFVIGSGNHARSYLHLDSAGKLTQMPLGWYSENGGYWAMSPGYDQPRHKSFGREISFDCMFCHNGYPEIAPGEDAPGRDARYRGRLAEGIDCQRCHGPGRAHIEAVARSASAEEIRGAIVNPSRLGVERQIELCMQCHLETTSRPLPYTVGRFESGAFSYRPGQPLAEYTLHFDRAPGRGSGDSFEIAHAAYRLRKSACFLKTRNLPAGRALTCTSCHNPHDIPRGEAAVRHYVEVCAGCHESSLARLVEAGKHTKASNCLDCHMPKRRTDDVVHVVMTDHYIQRHKPARDLLAPIEEIAETPETAYRGEVVPYYPAQWDNNPQAELYLAVAQVMEGANLKEGIPRLEQAIAKQRPADGDFYFQLAEAYWKNGETQKSLQLYEAAIQRSPNHRAALRNFAVALSRSGQGARAVELLKRALGSDPRDAKALSNLGEVYLQQGLPRQALEVLQQAVRIDPNLPQAQSNLASALSRTGDEAGALAAAREAIRIQPDYEAAHNNLANLLATAGQLDQAGQQYKIALALDPDHAEAHYNYAGLLAQQQKFADAEQQLRAALRLSPNLARAHNNLGNLLAMRGATGEAIRHFRAAVQADDNFAEAYFNLGTALGSQNQHAEAAEHLVKALRLNPQYEQARLNLGFALAAQGDLAGARQQFQQVAQSGQERLREAARHALRQIDTP
jgi:predicted CXXCH cytochrome family protein